MPASAKDLPPEVLNRVFSFSGNRRSAVRVCKLWAAWVIPHLWHALESPIPLFALLAPLTSSDLGRGMKEMNFTRDIEPDDWNRFHRYASFVRELQIMDWKGSVPVDQPHTQAFAEVALSKPPTVGDLLPKLQRLTIGTADPKKLRCATLFLSSGLSYLHISIFLNSGLTIPMLALIKHARWRCRLTELSLDYPSGRGPFDVDGPSSSYVTTGFEEIKAVTLRRGGTTGRGLAGLAQLPKLQAIRQAGSRRPRHFGGGEELTDEAYDSQASLNLPSTSFPCLTCLTVDLRLGDIPRFLGQSCFTSLTELNIFSDARIGNFREAMLSLTGLGLVTLRIRPYDEWDEALLCVDLESLQPITLMPQLRTFELWPQVPLQLSPQDFETLAKGLPLIEHLVLGETGWRDWNTATGPDATPIGVLVPFATYCPNLRSFAFAFNASLPSPVPATLPRFSKLERLGVVGASIEPKDVQRIAGVIVSMSPDYSGSSTGGKTTISLDADISSRSSSIWAPHALVAEDYFALWEEVGRLAEAIMSERIGYERRIRDLEDQLRRAKEVSMDASG
ncbi:hypothetical protein FRC00_000997 [Tulasnella sp. 408]|nr:hypothetical protein FRC00_000997 [Tulasnella sp. 408]